MKLQPEITAILAVHARYERFRRLPLVRALPGPARRALFAIDALVRDWAQRRAGEQ